jgi:hypothetical protein
MMQLLLKIIIDIDSQFMIQYYVVAGPIAQMDDAGKGMGAGVGL